MKVLIKLATVICAVGSFSPVPALALNAISSGSVSNNYLFIENAIDSEYFITPSALDPRFSGSNTWIKWVFRFCRLDCAWKLLSGHVD